MNSLVGKSVPILREFTAFVDSIRNGNNGRHLDGLPRANVLKCDLRQTTKIRRGGRAADCTGLENRRWGNPFASSNLAPSAFSFYQNPKTIVHRCRPNEPRTATTPVGLGRLVDRIVCASLLPPDWTIISIPWPPGSTLKAMGACKTIPGSVKKGVTHNRDVQPDGTP